MDISGLTSSSASQSFPGYGGTASLPAVTQAKIMVQSQSLSLLPTASSANLGNLADIYTAVGKQALGALSGLSALEITNLSMGIGDGQTTAAPSAASPGAATPATAAATSLSANAAANFPGSYYPSSADPDYFFHSSPTTTTAAEAIDPNTADPNGATATASDPSAAQAATDSTTAQATTADTSTFKDPAIGATLDQLLKEDGYVAPDANPYVVNNDFFSDQGSLGGLLDSTV